MEDNKTRYKGENKMTTCKKIPHTLFIWDFDWTVVNCNSDEYIPGQFISDADLISGFHELYASLQDWHSCVEEIVSRAITNGATPDTILDAARKMPYLTGVRKALDDIKEVGNSLTGQMILSDGNTMFISAFLEENGLVEHFTNGIITNEGSWDDSSVEHGGTIRLRVVHQSKQYGGHNCAQKCPANLCKTQALQDTLNRMLPKRNQEEMDMGCHEQERPRLVYVGDGANDACPVLNILQESDVLLARAGTKRGCANLRSGPETDEEAECPTTVSEGSQFGILPALDRAKQRDSTVKCQVWEWSSGDELSSLVTKLLNDIPNSK